MPADGLLFIGITSSNSELFLPHCLRAIKTTTSAVNTRVVVLDNASDDASARHARELGAEVLIERCSQADAMNLLISLSRARYTLLIHADIILLNTAWFDLCQSKVKSDTVLVAPEDIGCGPLTRPFGSGKPESSFLFFQTGGLQKLRSIRWEGRRFFRIPRRCVDLYGPHVTHKLPNVLSERGLSWYAMNVHCSGRVEVPLYEPEIRPKVWSDELPHLRYGLGNFYSIDGVITHYHNWYDRIHSLSPAESPRDTGDDFPLPYIKAYTDAFLSDYEWGRLVVPSASQSDR